MNENEKKSLNFEHSWKKTGLLHVWEIERKMVIEKKLSRMTLMQKAIDDDNEKIKMMVK